MSKWTWLKRLTDRLGLQRLRERVDRPAGGCGRALHAMARLAAIRTAPLQARLLKLTQVLSTPAATDKPAFGKGSETSHSGPPAPSHGRPLQLYWHVAAISCLDQQGREGDAALVSTTQLSLLPTACRDGCATPD